MKLVSFLSILLCGACWAFEPEPDGKEQPRADTGHERKGQGGGLDEIEISVPKAAKDKPSVGSIIVNVTKDGAISVGGKGLTSDELLKKLSAVAKEFKDQPVILRGDRETAFDHIVSVLNVCQKAGIWNVAFATVQPSKAGAAPPSP